MGIDAQDAEKAPMTSGMWNRVTAEAVDPESNYASDGEEREAPAMFSVKSHPFGGMEAKVRHRKWALLALAAAGSIVLMVFHAMLAPQSSEPSDDALYEAPLFRDSSKFPKVRLAECDYQTAAVCAARNLFYNPEVINIATDCLMLAGHELLTAVDRKMVKEIVASSLSNISARLQMEAPEVAHMLDIFQLSQPQKDAVLSALVLASDRRVQEIGMEVGRAIRGDDADAPAGKDTRHRIEARLHPRLHELWRLRSQLVPLSLQELWGTGSPWELTLDPENIAAMSSDGGGWDGMQNGKLRDAPLTRKQKIYSVYSGALEEGRALIDTIKLSAQVYGKELHVPRWAASVVDNLGPQVYCDLEKHGRSSHEGLMKALFCKMKFGIQGLEALRAVPDIERGLATPFWERVKQHAASGETQHTSRAGSVLEDGPSCSYGQAVVCPARDLFLSSDVVEVATSSLMQVGESLFVDGDRALVKATMSFCFREVLAKLQVSAPDVAHELEVLQLSSLQKSSILTLLRLASDERLQDLGLEVAHAIRGGGASPKPEEVQKRIEERLQPLLPQIKELRASVIPPALLELWGSGNYWDMTLDPENLRMMGAGGAGVAGALTQAAAANVSHVVMAGATEEARVLVDSLKLCTRLLGKELDLPSWATSALPAAEGRKLPPCSLSKPSAASTTTDFTELLICPLKFGIQGLDALRAMHHMLHTGSSEPPPEHVPQKPPMTEPPPEQQGAIGTSRSSHIGHPPEHTAVEHGSHIGHPPEHTVVEHGSHIGHPPEHTVVEHGSRVGHPPEQTRVENSPGRPPKNTRAGEGGPLCAYGEMPVCPARDLLESSEVFNMATDVLMRVGRGLLVPSDRGMVLGLVSTSLRNISSELEAHAPEVAHDLEMLLLSALQKNAVLVSLRLLAEPRVQHLGREVARGIRESASARKADVLRSIETRLKPRRRWIRELRNELVPAEVLELWGEGHEWAMTLDAENVGTMRKVRGDFVAGYRQAASVDLAKKSYGVLGGVLEEGRALLDIIALCTRVSGKELKVPGWATSLVGKLGPQLLPCELDATVPRPEETVDFMKALYCPLKFATQGVDALRALSDMAADFQDDEQGRTAHAGAVRPDSMTRPSAKHDEVETQGPRKCSYDEHETCPARSLFQNDEVLTAAADCLMQVGTGVLIPSDSGIVASMVAESFRNVSDEIALHLPQVARQLESVQLTKPQKDAILTSMALLSDPRVQSLGLDVARAIRSSASPERTYVKHQIEVKLRPRLQEILELRDELVPAPVREIWGAGQQWEMTLDPENIGIMLMVSGKFASHFTPSTPPDLEKKTLGIVGGVLEESRALVNIIKLCTRLFGKELSVPVWTTSIVNKMGPAILPCEADDTADSKEDFMRALFCPLKFGTQGLEAIRAASDMAQKVGLSDGDGHTGTWRRIGHPPEHTRVEREQSNSSGLMTARDFFESAEVVEVATEGLMKVGQGVLLASDAPMVQDMVTASLRNMSGQLQQHPKVARELEELLLTELQRKAILMSLQLVSDERLQRVGLDIARAIRGSSSAKAEKVQQRIEEEMQPHLQLLHQLREELVPRELLELWGPAHQWEITLDPGNIGAMMLVSGKFAYKVRSHVVADLQKKSYAILGGVLQEGRILLDVIKLCTRLYGNELEAPSFSEALVGQAAGSDLLPCEFDTEEGSNLDFMKDLYCPLKFGVQGLEALRAVTDMEKKAGAKDAEEGAKEEEAASACVYGEQLICPAQTLFGNSEVIDVATESLMQVANELLKSEDIEMVRRLVAQSLRNLRSRIARYAPEASKELERLQLTRVQQNAVLNSMWLVSDARVQGIGLEVARAIRGSMSANPEDVKHEIETRLQERLPEIRKLRDEIVPESLRALWGPGENWQMSLDPENIGLIMMVSGGFSLDFRPTRPVDLEEKTKGVVGGVMEEGRALLDIIKLCTRLFGKELDVPTWVSLPNGAPHESLPAELSCELTDGASFDFVKSIFCPLKFGTLGLDALRAVSEMGRNLGVATNSSSAAVPHRCVYNEISFCSVQDLFESPEILEVATVGLMRVGHEFLVSSDIGVIRDTIAATFKNISAQLQEDSVLAPKLKMLQISKLRIHAVLTSMWLLSDPRVQDIGRMVAQAVHDSSDWEDMPDQIEKKLEPHLKDIQALRKELVPAPLRELWSSGPQWELLRDPENLKALRIGSGKFVTPSNLSSLVDQTQKSYGIVGGVSEEGRALVDVINLYASLFGDSVALPAWVTRMTGSIDPETRSCQVTEDGTVNPRAATMQALFCPLKFGRFGIDALRAVSTKEGGWLATLAAPASARHIPAKPVQAKTGHGSSAQPPAGRRVSCTHQGLPFCPAMDLFESPEVVEVVGEALLRESSSVLMPADRMVVKDIVARSFRNISAQLRERVPEVAEGLEKLLLSELQKDAVLASLQLVSEPKVQGIGLLVARAIHESTLHEKNYTKVTRDFVRRHVEQQLRPHMQELADLRDQLIPVALRALWGSRHPWQMTLDPENIGVMLGSSGDFGWDVDDHTELDVVNKSYAVLAGVLEEGRALIDIIQLCTRSHRRELSVPPWATSLVGRVGPELYSCQRGATPDARLDAMKALFCPLKFGTQGLDALRAYESMERTFGGPPRQDLDLRPDQAAIVHAEPRTA